MNKTDNCFEGTVAEIVDEGLHEIIPIVSIMLNHGLSEIVIKDDHPIDHVKVKVQYAEDETGKPFVTFTITDKGVVH